MRISVLRIFRAIKRENPSHIRCDSSSHFRFSSSPAITQVNFKKPETNESFGSPSPFSLHHPKAQFHVRIIDCMRSSFVESGTPTYTTRWKEQKVEWQRWRTRKRGKVYEREGGGGREKRWGLNEPARARFTRRDKLYLPETWAFNLARVYLGNVKYEYWLWRRKLIIVGSSRTESFLMNAQHQLCRIQCYPPLLGILTSFEKHVP